MPQINLKKEVLAHMELQRQGSVMAKDREPEWRTRNPLLGTMLDVIDSVLAFGPSPTDAGGKQAIIQMIGKTSNIVEETAKHAPKVVSAAKSTSRRVLVEVAHEPDRTALGYYQNFSPKLGRVYISEKQPEPEKIITAAHELQHFLTALRVESMPTENAIQSAEQIATFLPMVQKHKVLNYVARAKEAVRHGKSLPSSLKVIPDIGKSEARQAYTESLSYLTESLLTPEGYDDKFLHNIANSLGVGIR